MSSNNLSTSKENIVDLILECIHEFNDTCIPGRRLDPSPSTSLMPGSSGLDSLAVVNLFSIIEEKVEAQYGVALSLAAEAGEFEHPWESVTNLATFLSERLQRSRP